MTLKADYFQKQKFVIYDFFGNHKHFNNGDADIFIGSGQEYTLSEISKAYRPVRNLIESGISNEWFYGLNYAEIGPEAERVDKRSTSLTVKR